MHIKRLASVVLLIGALGVPPAAGAQSSAEPNPSKPWESSAPDAGRAFEPPSAPATYAAPMAPNKSAQVQWDPPAGVTCGRFQVAGPGCVVYVETWLPQDKEGVDPSTGQAYPKTAGRKWPVIFSPTVYFAGGGAPDVTMAALIERGYAFSVVHLPGSGESPGCVDRHGMADAAASSAAVEYLAGKRADANGKLATDDWSDGRLGGWGVSYAGGATLNVAARGTATARDSISAIVVIAPHLSDYESQWIFDGVRSTGIQPVHGLAYMGALYDTTAPKEDLSRDHDCQHKVLAENATNPQANVTPYFQERDHRLALAHLKVPVLSTHGHPDLIPGGGVPPMVQAGFFDQLPGGTDCGPDACKRGLFGMWGHSRPSTHPTWGRGDWVDTLVGWYDRWVRGVTEIRVEDWPVVQVQGTDGQWRAEPNWPTTGGPVGQLALGPVTASGLGLLGATAPTGESAYVEGLPNDAVQLPGQQLVYETPPLPGRLQITGQPVADLWLKLDRPDAHVAARLEILDKYGQRISETRPKGYATGWTYGLRSARHLSKLRSNLFVQDHDTLPPIGVPIRVPVRFQPTDLVVPEGGKLRLTISGSTMVNPGLEQLNSQLPNDPLLGFSEPSGFGTRVTVLHECTAAPPGTEYAGAPMVSTLRFLMPSANADLLNVREIDEGSAHPHDPKHQPLVNGAAGPLQADGGGIAAAPVCGKPPSRIMDVISSLGAARATLKFASSSAKTGSYGDEVTIEADLTSSDGPIAGATVTFHLGDVARTATTDDVGRASTSFKLDMPPGDYPVRAAFAGKEGAQPTKVLSVLAVSQEKTALDLDVTGVGSTRQVVATLMDDDEHPVAGRVVDFYADGVKISGGGTVTDPSGVVEFVPPPRYLGSREYSAVFEGDTYYVASSSDTAEASPPAQDD